MADLPPRIAVTGAGGFVGSAVLRALARRPVEVHALCNRRDPGSCAGPAVRWWHGSIDDRDVLYDLLAGVDLVVHLAGPPSVADSFRWPEEFVRAHVCGTVALLEVCRRLAVRRVVYLSSAEVYGAPAATPVGEDATPAPRSPYGAAKLSAEHFLGAFALAGGVRATILRAFSIYGPEQPPNSVLEVIRRQAATRNAIELADLSPVRDFCHVDDVAAALLRAAGSAPAEPVRVFNIGTGRGTSIGTLARLVLEAMQRPLPVRQAARRDRPPAALAPELVADARRAERELEWRPRWNLRDGLRTLLRPAPEVA